MTLSCRKRARPPKRWLAGSLGGCLAPKALACWLQKQSDFSNRWSWRHFARLTEIAYCTQRIAYRDCIYRLHLWSHRKIAYMDCIQRLHIKIAHKDCMLRFHTKIEYKDWRQRLHISITYKDCVHKHMIQILWIKNTVWGLALGLFPFPKGK